MEQHQQNNALPEERVTKFLRKHHVLTLATVGGDGAPYCSNMFYAWWSEQTAFVFTSATATRHAAEAEAHPVVAGSVVLESRIIGKLQGVQFTGRMYRPQGEQAAEAKRRYLKRFPYAAVMDLELWVLEPDYIKMTDNELGFGKKLIWQRIF